MKIEEKTEESRRTRIKMKYREIKMWMSDKGLSEDLRTRIRGCIKQHNVAEKYIEVPVDLLYFYRAQQHDVARSVWSYLRKNALKKVRFSTQSLPI